MKKFTIPCSFGDKKAPFDVYIGNPKPGHHPLQHQASWLSKERGGSIPAEVMESFGRLLDLAEKHKVSYEELCVYAIGEANKNNEGNGVVAADAAVAAPPAEAPKTPGMPEAKPATKPQQPAAQPKKPAAQPQQPTAQPQQPAAQPQKPPAQPQQPAAQPQKPPAQPQKPPAQPQQPVADPPGMPQTKPEETTNK